MLWSIFTSLHGWLLKNAIKLPTVFLPNYRRFSQLSGNKEWSRMRRFYCWSTSGSAKWIWWTKPNEGMALVSVVSGGRCGKADRCFNNAKLFWGAALLSSANLSCCPRTADRFWLCFALEDPALSSHWPQIFLNGFRSKIFNDVHIRYSLVGFF